MIRHKVEEHMPSWRGDTSMLFVIGKAAGLKLVKTNKTFREQAEVARSMKSSKHQVTAADEKVMTIALKGKQSDHLDAMRYQRFQELVTTGKKAIHPNTLPPKCPATKYHRLRINCMMMWWQLSQWLARTQYTHLV